MPSRTTRTRRRPPARRAAGASRRQPADARRRGRGRRGSRAFVGGPSGWIAVVTVIVFAGLVGVVAAAGHALSSTAAAPPSDTPSVAPAPAPAPPPAPAVAGYGIEQLTNACAILSAGHDLGMSERDRIIAVMTAMGESSLRNIDYGDWETSGVTNPDGSRTTSIGLFQQQDGWGPREARLDPYAAATMFYRAMTARVPDRDTIEPTLVAHRTQVNADPRHYERFWERARRVVAALNGVPLAGDNIRGIPICAAAQP